jgi:ABC-type Fe3+-siderophore transport system permease subunit
MKRHSRHILIALLLGLVFLVLAAVVARSLISRS